jgi:NADH-quinone oxidoreductase subunit M
MILAWLLIIPLLGGVIAWHLDRGDSDWPRWVSLASLFADLVLALALWSGSYRGLARHTGQWFAELDLKWIPQLGISFHLAVDGLSHLMVLLTVFLGIMAVVISWTEIGEDVGSFHLNLMLILTGIIGVFLSIDLFLFYFFWELMLIPMYFLISIWGHENRVYASIKFFLFTQLSGLLMLISILGLYFIHGKNTGVYTFDYTQLLGTSMSPVLSFWLMLGFLAAFAVKLPAFPLHTWLPDAIRKPRPREALSLPDFSLRPAHTGCSASRCRSSPTPLLSSRPGRWPSGSRASSTVRCSPLPRQT